MNKETIIKLKVERLLNDSNANFGFKLIAGNGGLKREIKAADLSRPGLALSGYLKYFHNKCVQVFGKQELSYLEELRPGVRKKVIEEIFKCGFPCAIITWAMEAPKEIIDAANKYKIPLLLTSMPTSKFMIAFTHYIENRFVPHITIHGGLVDVYGVGVLILGKSGVGKSECALELIERGHRLVADDVIEIRCVGKKLIGSSSELIQHHMEIRGLGIINIRELYGAGAVCPEKEIELVANLEVWKGKKEYDRLGVDESKANILGIEIPQIVIPVKPGRNIAIIIEVAAKNHRLKGAGYFSAREFDRELLARIRKVEKQQKIEN